MSFCYSVQPASPFAAQQRERLAHFAFRGRRVRAAAVEGEMSLPRSCRAAARQLQLQQRPTLHHPAAAGADESEQPPRIEDQLLASPERDANSTSALMRGGSVSGGQRPTPRLSPLFFNSQRAGPWKVRRLSSSAKTPVSSLELAEPLRFDHYPKGPHPHLSRTVESQLTEGAVTEHFREQGYRPSVIGRGGGHWNGVMVGAKTWKERKALVRNTSPFGHLPGWTLKSFIVKSGDDVLKEMLAMQLIEYCQHIFRDEGLDIFLRPYQIVSTGYMAGLIEFIEGAQSIDRIKKSLNGGATVASPESAKTLKDHFIQRFGPSYSVTYARAMHNFVRSLVGYSLVTYLLQAKDRHNANILIDQEGHLVHIDYGFIMGGFNINFESAPFKLTREYIDVMGGLDSDAFRSFEDLFLRGFQALQKHTEGFTAIVQLFYGEKRKGAAESIASRLLFPSSVSDILSLVRESFDNWRTKQYDWYQQQTNNISM